MTMTHYSGKPKKKSEKQIPNIAWDIGTDEKTIREILGKLREEGIIR